LRFIGLINVLDVINCEKNLLEILEKSVLRLKMKKFQFGLSFVKITIRSLNFGKNANWSLEQNLRFWIEWRINYG